MIVPTNMIACAQSSAANQVGGSASYVLSSADFVFMPPPFVMGGGGHIASPLFVRPVRTKNGLRAISFKYIGVLDSYFIHRYIIIKYRSSLITDKIHQLLSELWPLIPV